MVTATPAIHNILVALAADRAGPGKGAGGRVRGKINGIAVVIAAVPAVHGVLGALPADGADPGKDADERVRRNGVNGGPAIQTVIPVSGAGGHAVVDRVEGNGVKAAVPALGAGNRRAALRAGPYAVEPGLEPVEFVDPGGQVIRAAASPDIEVGGGGSGGGAAVIEGGEHAPAVHVGLDVFDLQVAGCRRERQRSR